MLEVHPLDKKTPIPLYFQLKSLILDEIKSGKYKPGEMLPTELKLTEMFRISRTTVRQCITELAQEGYVYRVKSKGTFISPHTIEHHLPQDMTYYNDHSFEDDIKRTGKMPHTKILKLEEIDIPSVVLKDTEYRSPSGKVVILYRVRYADDIPFLRIVSYFNYEFCSKYIGTDIFEKHTVGEVLKMEARTTVAKISRTFEAFPPSEEDIKLLRINENVAIQKVTNIRHNSSGEFLDYSASYYRGDYCRISMDTLFHPEDKQDIPLPGGKI